RQGSLKKMGLRSNLVRLRYKRAVRTSATRSYPCDQRADSKTPPGDRAFQLRRPRQSELATTRGECQVPEDTGEPDRAVPETLESVVHSGLTNLQRRNGARHRKCIPGMTTAWVQALSPSGLLPTTSS